MGREGRGEAGGREGDRAWAERGREGEEGERGREREREREREILPKMNPYWIFQVAQALG